MENYTLALFSALWLGLLTSISPCPLTTNIAAMSYLGKHSGDHRRIWIAGVCYTLGRMVAYLVVAILVVKSLLAVPTLSFFLQQQINKVIGPVLVVTGMVLLDVIPINWGRGGISDSMSRRIAGRGYVGALALGFLFALAFCPVSAALFFGSLIPLALKSQSSFILPMMYGLGTALPVIAAAIILSISVQWLGRFFRSITRIERWTRRITAIVLILIGLYFCLAYLFNIRF